MHTDNSKCPGESLFQEQLIFVYPIISVIPRPVPYTYATMAGYCWYAIQL